MKPQEFINKIAPFAVQDSIHSGILASLTIAQAILESNWGDSVLTREANNLFGIKGKYKGHGYKIKTTEYYNGVKSTPVAEFRSYPTWAESISDHSALLQTKRYRKVKGECNYVKACQEIKEAGYATDPNYANKLIQIIQQYKLNKYDTIIGEAEGVDKIKGYVNTRVDNKVVQKNFPAYFMDNEALIPASVLKQHLGIIVGWDHQKKIVTLTKP